MASRAEEARDWATAYRGYTEAARDWPANTEYPLRRELARFHLVEQHVDRAEADAVAGQMGLARQELEEALALDPTYSLARERLQQLESYAAVPQDSSEQIEGEVQVQPTPGNRSFNYRGDTQGAYEEVARQFGLTAAFDPDLRSRQIGFRVSNVDFWTAMRVLGGLTRTFWRPVNSRLFLVTEDTPQKIKEYALSVARTVALPDSVGPDQMTEILRLVRDVAGITRTQLDQSSRTLTLRATPQAVALAEELIREIEQPRGELMLDMLILEVDRNAARRLGITPPSTARTFTISPQDIQQAQQSLQGLFQVLTRLFGQPSSLAGLSANQIGALLASGQIGAGTLVPPLVAFGGGRTTFLATLPGAAADFSETLSLIQQGRQVLLRAQDGKPASFFVGDRFPVTLALLSGSGVTSPLISQVNRGNFVRTDFGTGRSPAAVVAADFNEDNRLDLAVANQTDNTVSILLGNGDGTFGTRVDFPTGTEPAAVVAADFNADSHLDLAVVNQNCPATPCPSGSVSILFGDGRGGFTPQPSPPAVGTSPVAIVAGDFNPAGDPSRAAKIDLAVANQGSNSITILLNNGSGTFTPAPSPIPTGRAPVALAAGDFNGDGRLDLAVVNQGDNTVSIFLGNGDGTFTPQPNPLATGAGPAAIAAADFNSDGNLDLAVANQTDNTVSIFLGNGNGTFGAKTDFPTGTGPVSMTVADFNIDGVQDLAVADKTANTVSILLGLGNGTFAPKLDFTTGNTPVSVAHGDFNRDGLPDVAIANQADNTVSVILNSSSIQFGAAVSGQTPFPGSQYLDIGLKVRATPRLHPDGDVTLKVEVELRSLSGKQINSIPVISNRTLEQTVRLHEGETAALAQLLERQETLTLTGWPGFERAGRHEKNQEETELLILLTPRLLRLAPHVSRTLAVGREPGAPSNPLLISQP